LSNVSGGALNTRMYGVCLTAYRKESDDVDNLETDGGGNGGDEGGGVTLWWPVVLFMLSRYPVVPQLQRM
jgi:hypothetical protein